MEAPLDSSDNEEGSDDSLVLPEEYEEEVDINIHFHCEHCFKMGRCQERPKPGWACEIDYCFNGCGHRFHVCKTSEHRLMCSHERVPCINAGYGCPLWMQRRFIAEHLPFCPASVVICNAEWNRWALGAKEREKVAMTKGITALYNSNDLDMSLALRDQELVNEMQKMPKRVRNTLCNGITRRFPCLPLTIRGSRHHTPNDSFHDHKIAHSTTEEEDDDLTPGDSKRKLSHSRALSSRDDIAAIVCIHEIIKNICVFCRDDPDEPDYKMGKVWREHLLLKKPGEVRWVEEPCVEKIRKRNQFGMFAYKRYDESDEDEEEENSTSLDKMNLIFDEHGHPMGKRPRFQTPPPAPITPKGLTMELTLKHYSRHQTKPRAMFTFQCMQELRRSEYSSHYQNMHSEIQEGLDGWLIHRCPLHVFGCPFIYTRLHPGQKDGDVVYSHGLRAFGIKPKLEYEPAACGGLPRSRSPSVEKTTKAFGQLRLAPMQKSRKKGTDPTAEQYLASSVHLTYLPIEVLQKIAVYLDGYSLNNLSQSCRLMRDVCLSLLNERGLVIIEWVRYIEDNKIRWREGNKRRFFSKTFEHIHHWGFKDTTHMANHLEVCRFNKRHIADQKFAYILPRKDGNILDVLRHCRA